MCLLPSILPFAHFPSPSSGDIRRVSKFQQWAAFYRFQHIYLLVLYGLLAIKFRIQVRICFFVLLSCSVRSSLILLLFILFCPGFHRHSDQAHQRRHSREHHLL
jgi:hypothetical protein